MNAKVRHPKYVNPFKQWLRIYWNEMNFPTPERLMEEFNAEYAEDNIPSFDDTFISGMYFDLDNHILHFHLVSNLWKNPYWEAKPINDSNRYFPHIGLEYYHRSEKDYMVRNPNETIKEMDANLYDDYLYRLFQLVGCNQLGYFRETCRNKFVEIVENGTEHHYNRKIELHQFALNENVIIPIETNVF